MHGRRNLPLQESGGAAPCIPRKTGRERAEDRLFNPPSTQKSEHFCSAKHTRQEPAA